MPNPHFWVELKYTPISVMEDTLGNLVITVDQLSEETAHEEALNGCWFCFTPLTADTFHTQCDYDPAEHGPSSGNR